MARTDEGDGSEPKEIGRRPPYSCHRTWALVAHGRWGGAGPQSVRLVGGEFGGAVRGVFSCSSPVPFGGARRGWRLQFCCGRRGRPARPARSVVAGRVGGGARRGYLRWVLGFVPLGSVVRSLRSCSCVRTKKRKNEIPVFLRSCILVSVV